MKVTAYPDSFFEGGSRDLVVQETDGCFAWVMLLDAPTRRGLSRKVKERNWRKETGCGADCTGLVYASTCDLLRAFKYGDKWRGVVVCGEYRDV